MKLIVLFLVPVLLGNLFQQFYNIVDSIIVGRFVGVNAFAAVGSTGSLIYMVTGFIIGLCNGFAIPVAYYFGARDNENLKRTLAHIVYLSGLFAIVLTVLALGSADFVLKVMNTPTNIFRDAYAYVVVMYAGLGLTIFYNSLAAISRALGDSRTPLYFLIMSVVFNIMLDLFFVVTLHMGTAGVAYATVSSQGLAGLGCFVYMVRKFPEIRIDRGFWKVKLTVIRKLMVMGLPMALQSSIMSIGTLVLQCVINPLGSAVVAGVTAAEKVQQVVITPIDAFGVTMATYASQNLGAKAIKRIAQGIRAAMVMNIVLSIFAFVVSVQFGTTISRLFITGSATHIFAYIRQFLFVNGFFYFALGALNIYKNSLQGIGHAISAMGAGLFELLARLTISVLFVGKYGFAAVCFANGAAWVAASLFVMPVFYSTLAHLKKTRLHNHAHPAVGATHQRCASG